MFAYSTIHLFGWWEPIFEALWALSFGFIWVNCKHFRMLVASLQNSLTISTKGNDRKHFRVLACHMYLQTCRLRWPKPFSKIDRFLCYSEFWKILWIFKNLCTGWSLQMRRFKLNFEFGLGKGVPVSFSPPTTFLSEDFDWSKFLSLIGEDKNWIFPIGYSKSS